MGSPKTPMETFMIPLVIDLEDKAYDNHDFEHIDPPLPDQIIY